MNHVARRKFGKRPWEDFFAPEHAQVIMDAPFAEELGLRGILEGIVSLCGFKLFERQRRKPKARKATKIGRTNREQAV